MPDGRATELAVSLTSTDVPLARQVRAAAEAGASLVELRVDCIRDVAAVESLLREPRTMPLILTVRSSEEGGECDHDESQRIALIERLGLLNPGFVDVEWRSWKRSDNLRQKVGLVAQRTDRADTSRDKNRLILSYHDMRETPASLAGIFDELSREPAEIIKVVFSAYDASDAIRVLAQVQRLAEDRPIIGLAMGEAGLATRVLARKFGAFLTFAALERGRESAAGQPTIADLRDVYRWNAIQPTTRVFGVIGWPVSQSLGPRIHNAAMIDDGIDGVYLPLPVASSYEAFAQFMQLVIDSPWLDLHGLSVTMPHKEHALKWIEERGYEIGPTARDCQAVNTLSRTRDGRWRGDNTDADGILAALYTAQPLRDAGMRNKTALVLGAGGAARAAVAALRSAGALVVVANRTESRGAALAEAYGCRSCPWDRRSEPLADILINCTHVGMAPAVDVSPMPIEALRCGSVVMDTVYNPSRTRLLADAAERGAIGVSGVEMFVRQAGAQYRRWHNQRAPLEAFRRVLRSL